MQKINKLLKIFKFRKMRSYRQYRGMNGYNKEIKEFINTSNYSSSTDFLIYVDKKNFKVNILKGRKNNFNVLMSFLCTIGKKSTPTPAGTFKIGIKGLYFGVNKGYKCWYYSSFKGNYLFHSIIYNLNGSVKDGRLGMMLSDGCIRLKKENAKYIYDNIPQGTTVIIK